MLTDKVVIITGGAGLLGKVFCESVIQNGGFSVIADLDENKGKEVEYELNKKYGNGKAFFNHIDIVDKKSIYECIEKIVIKYKKIDALVNNAYPRNNNYGRHFYDVEYKDFCENINLHLGGYFLMCQQFAKLFKTQGFGNIINIASIYGVIAPKFEIYNETNLTMPVEYAAIKSALIHLTKYIAKYLKGCNVRVNCISPGGIFDNQPESFLESYKAYSLYKGMLDKTDIQGTLIFLLSDYSKYINGQNIIVDDGFSL